jgi:hypothetical protein
LGFGATLGLAERVIEDGIDDEDLVRVRVRVGSVLGSG